MRGSLSLPLIAYKELVFMVNTNAAQFQENLSSYLAQAVLHQDVINVNTDNGNAVLISEEEYNSLKERIYLIK